MRLGVLKRWSVEAFEGRREQEMRVGRPGFAVLASLFLAQGSTLLRQVFPQPSGNNGYELYLQAADITLSREFQTFKKWSESLPKSTIAPPAGLNPNSTPLAQKRFEVQAFGRALKLIADGNLKPVSRVPGIPFVENDGFRDLTKLEVNAAYVAYADGNWTKAVNQLLDLVTFADNVSRTGIPGQLAGGFASSAAFAAFDAHKSQWSVEDCSHIALRVGDILDEATTAAIATDEPPPAEAVAIAIRTPIQLRILRLHALIQRFKWHNGRLPIRLTEAASPDDAFDPLSAEPFGYQAAGASYKLFSKGSALTGQIELRGKR